MKNKIIHRVNTIKKLKSLNKPFGVEVDLRNHNNDIILHHEPYVVGENFDTFLNHFELDFIILNIKSEGIEEEVLRLVKKNNVPDYFFLDTSIPFMVKYINKGFRKFAVRFSEYETLDFVLNFKGKVEWVWVDCFNKMPLDEKTYNILKKQFKICLVSPELQGHSLSRVKEFKTKTNKFDIEAVCTKRPDLW